MSAIIEVVIFFILAITLGTLVIATLSAAPWVPLFKKDIHRMIKLAELKPGQLVYDLGCGDGRILIEAVKQTSVRAVGFELSLIPYLIAKIRVRLSGLHKMIDIRFHDFFSADLSAADAILCFLTPYAMKKLEPKINQELKTDACFLTYAFPLPNLKPQIKDKPDPKTMTIFLYRGE
ncbi:MAG: class I SAM-dependent methyltransferase [Patescibacteria group bacterium]